MTTMTFAPGWTQQIDTTDEGRERADLLCYINDTHKAVYGYRPRWDRGRIMSPWLTSVKRLAILRSPLLRKQLLNELGRYAVKPKWLNITLQYQGRRNPFPVPINLLLT